MPQCVPTQLAPLVVVSIFQCVSSPLDLTSFPTRRSSDLTFSPVTSTMYSINPNPLRPVGVTTGVIVMPLAINVPPFPSDTPRWEEHTAELQSHLDIVSQMPHVT